MKLSQKKIEMIISNQEQIINLVIENKRILERLEELLRMNLMQNIINEYDSILHLERDVRQKLLTSLANILSNHLAERKNRTNFLDAEP